MRDDGMMIASEESGLDLVGALARLYEIAIHSAT